MTTAMEFAEAARSLKGIPFHHRGRTTSGADCIGLPFVAAMLCSLNIRPFIAYERTPDEAVLLAAVAERCEPRDWHEWNLPGRMLVLRQRSGGPARHFAITLGDGWAIHQETRARTVMLSEKLELVHSCWLVRGVDA